MTNPFLHFASSISGELGDGGIENASPSKRKRKNGDLNPDATLEPTLEALNVKKFDLAFAVDPLFHKTSAQFDEGGAQGLLLNNLSVFHGCDIVFDSMDIPEEAVDSATCLPAATASALISLEGLKPQLQALSHVRGDERISPALDDILSLLGAGSTDADAAHAEAFVQRVAHPEFAPAAAPSSEAGAAVSAPDSPAEMQGMDGVEIPAAYAMDYANDDDDNDHNDGGACDEFHYYNDGGDCRGDEEQEDGPARQAATAQTLLAPVGNLDDDAISWLISAGASSAGASYVTASTGWAGGSHWKYRAVPHAQSASGGGVAGDDGDQEVDQEVFGKKKARGSSRRKNEPLDFVALMQGGSEPVFDMMPRGTARRHATKAKPKAKTLLPEDYHYNAEFLGRYALRPRCFVGVGGGIHGAATGTSRDPEDAFADLDTFGGYDGADDDDVSGVDSYGGEWGGGGGDVGDALDLVDAARKVEKVDVNYSKAAKQVDVRFLKELMWHGIHQVMEKRQSRGIDRDVPIEFADILATVPAVNAAGRLDDLSVHLCFICVLHLANEHGLVIQGVSGLDHLLISNVPATA